MTAKQDVLPFLMKLNSETREREQQLQLVTGPGLPLRGRNARLFISKDCMIARSVDEIQQATAAGS